MDVPCFIAYFMYTCFVSSVLIKKIYCVYFGIIFCFHNAAELENCFVVIFVAIKVY